MRKKALFIILVALIAVFVTACGNSSANGMISNEQDTSNLLDMDIENIREKPIKIGKSIPDPQEGLVLIEEAAEQGNVKAMNFLVHAYIHGDYNVQSDFSKAFEICKKAADMGDLEAIKNMALIYDNGIGVERDKDKADEWRLIEKELLEKQASSGSGEIFYELANFNETCWKYGDLEKEREYQKKAQVEFEKRANEGDVDAMIYLGKLFRLGRLSDDEQSFYWYKKAADAGNPDAMYWIGCRYKGGYLVQENSDIALEWFEKAADAGSPDAMNTIAEMYIDNELPYDFDKVHEWSEKAELAKWERDYKEIMGE